MAVRCWRYFNPRTPCGVRPDCLSYAIFRAKISIHAPLAGCDSTATNKSSRPRGFQSTHPLRGATMGLGDQHHFQPISIHAPLAGCDSIDRADHPLNRDFNPRTPCGVRHVQSKSPSQGRIFQSTHPLRGATEHSQTGVEGDAISIHAPLAGCDYHGCATLSTPFYFNPRTPCGVRPDRYALLAGQLHFNPRTPCGVRRCSGTGQQGFRYFNPRTPCGVRQQ